VYQHGIDDIYLKDGKYCIVESKFTSASGNFYKSDLGTGYGATQMSDKWIEGALKEMKKQKTISSDLYNNLKNAIANGNVEKELIITRNAADEGHTIGKSIAQDPDPGGVNLDRITIINLGGTIVY